MPSRRPVPRHSRPGCSAATSCSTSWRASAMSIRPGRWRRRQPWRWRSSRWPIAPATTSCAVRCQPRRSTPRELGPGENTVERHKIIELMGQLKLAGMRAAYDELMTAGLRAQHSAQRIIGELLLAQLADNRARSAAYRLGVARFPVMKNLAEFDFSVSPVNEGLGRELHEGGFLVTQRNAVLIGGTGTGKSHVSIAIGANCVRNGARVRFFTAIDLVNQLEAEARAGKAGRLADQLVRVDLVILDELGYLPFPVSGGQMLFHLISRLCESFPNPLRVRFKGVNSTMIETSLSGGSLLGRTQRRLRIYTERNIRRSVLIRLTQRN